MPYGIPPGLRTFAVDNVAGNASAGLDATGDRNTFVGVSAGADTPGDDSVALGRLALNLAQGSRLVGIGNGAAQNSNGDDHVAIGFGALDAGIPAGDGNGIIAIGANALGAVAQTHADGRIVAIGDGAFAAYPGAAFFRDVTAIGADVGERYTVATTLQESVFIGQRAAFNGAEGFNNCVFVGARSVGLFGAAIIGGNNNTAIGDQSLGDLTTGVNNVGVGGSVLANITTSTQNVVVGSNAGESVNSGSDQNVVVGERAAPGFGDLNVYVGHAAAEATSSTASDRNTAVGGDVMQQTGAVAPGVNNVALGYGAASSGLPANYNDRLAIETDISGTHQPCIYGEINNANVQIGEDGANRGFSGTSVVKISSGTAPSANPVAGGYLYVTAGALNYRGTAGTITALAAA